MIASPIVDWIEGLHRRAGVETRGAYESLGSGDFPRAESLFRSALELDPCSRTCWRGLGTALRMMKRSDEAVAAFEQAVAAYPGDPELWRQLGLAHREARRPEEALRCLEESMRRGGRDTTALVDVAEIHAEQGQYLESAAAYSEIFTATGVPEARDMCERVRTLALQHEAPVCGVEPAGAGGLGGLVTETESPVLRSPVAARGLCARTVFPPVAGRPGWTEKVATRLGFWGPMLCPVCGRIAVMRRIEPNVRETCLCSACGSNNRKRQIAHVIVKTLSAERKTRIRSAADLIRFDDLTIFNTEAEGALHEALKSCPGYASSEYFGPSYRSGERVDGVMHQDLTDLSFDSGSLDLVISSDVMEHIPHPYTAHAEIFRVLKSGGRHVFTVPFGTNMHLDKEIARLDGSGRPVFFGEPVYHGDPVRENQGAPVFRIFGLEMISNLARLGFRTNGYVLHGMRYGIFGHNLGCGTVVFDAVKV